MAEATISADNTLELKESKLSDYLELLKPRVMSLVVFTAIIGLYLAPGTIHPVIATLSVICIAIASGGSGALNMWYDRDIDQLMDRTKKRPIPSKKIHPSEALTLGIFLSILSVSVMGLFVNVLSAGILAFTIFFYSVVYTIWLKRYTAQNIVIGGAAGALPPVIGWASVTGTVTIEPILLFLIIFIWTPPHFWALALHNSKEYKKANIPMMPLVAGEKSTKIQILAYTIALVLLTTLPYILHIAGFFYLCTAIVTGIIFIYYSVKMLQNSKYNMTTFKYSILYLFVIFTSLAIDKI
jgi:protoheme IX farnesyltransferase